MTSVLPHLEEIAYAMNRTGTPVDPDRYQKAVEAAYPANRAAAYLDVLHGDILYGQWKVSESDFFWRCRNPPLMGLPHGVQATFKGKEVHTYQPYLFEAARAGGSREWVNHYASGGDLLELAATKLGLGRQEAKTAIYRYIYGGVDSATTWQVESTFPWLAELVDRMEQQTLRGETAITRFGTPLGNSLFPRATLGRYLTQTVKDVTRMGVQFLWSEYKVAPSLILPDSVIVPSHHEVLARLWGAEYGFQVQVHTH